MPFTKITDKKGCDKLLKLLHDNKVIICYHMNGCIHCETLMPIFNKVIIENKDLIKDANVFSVETQYLNLLPQQLQNVQGFPYIVAIENGERSKEFLGSRTEQNIKEFIDSNKTTRPTKPTKMTLRPRSKTVQPRKKRVLKKT